MDRRSFLKLAAASPALASSGEARGPARNAGGYASGAAGGSQAPDFTFHSPLAEAWYRAGEYFEWTSTTPNNAGRRVRVFHRTFGDRANPALVLLHGYPTSSFDFREMIPFLEDDYFVAILDFPGFGFSDKPQDGYSYMLEDDAKLVDYFVREIVGLSRFHLLTHDPGRGSTPGSAWWRGLRTSTGGWTTSAKAASRALTWGLVGTVLKCARRAERLVHGASVSWLRLTGTLPATMMGPAATSFLPRASTLRFRPSSVRAPSSCRSPGCPNTTSSVVNVPPARTTANPIERTSCCPLAMTKRMSLFSGSMPM